MKFRSSLDSIAITVIAFLAVVIGLVILFSGQWVFVLGGQMEIGLQDGHSRVFAPGQHFYSADLLPQGALFDPAVHGHWSRQLGEDPLFTLFVRG